jgi:NADH:ubiquinone oxidoreductase subunit 6 (subunit J)
MLTFLVLAVGAVMVLVLVLFAIVGIGMRQEAPTEELKMHAPSLLAASIRRLLGVYVRKPDTSRDEWHGEPWLTARDAEGGESHCGHTRWSK